MDKCLSVFEPKAKATTRAKSHLRDLKKACSRALMIKDSITTAKSVWSPAELDRIEEGVLATIKQLHDTLTTIADKCESYALRKRLPAFEPRMGTTYRAQCHLGGLENACLSTSVIRRSIVETTVPWQPEELAQIEIGVLATIEQLRGVLEVIVVKKAG